MNVETLTPWQTYARGAKDRCTDQEFSEWVKRVNQMPEGPVKSTIAGIVWWDKGQYCSTPEHWEKYLIDLDSINHVTRMNLVHALIEIGYEGHLAQYRVMIDSRNLG